MVSMFVQVSPLQQVVSVVPLHTVPRTLQVPPPPLPPPQRRTPVASGVHGANPQH